MKFSFRSIFPLLLVIIGTMVTEVRAQEPAAVALEAAAEARAPDLAAQLRALNAESQAGRKGEDFGGRQRELIEQAVQTDPLAAARTILDEPELVMVGDFWLINVQALFRLWGKADLEGMAEWIKTHPLDPKLQPAADYALFQHRVSGLTESEAIALWRSQPAATRHWATKDVACIIAASDPATALERISRLFPTSERGHIMSHALDVVARKHPQKLLPWLAELSPFFYNEPAAWEALYRLPAADVDAAMAQLSPQARAEISLEYMRQCLRQEAHERARRLASEVTFEPYKSMMDRELKAYSDQLRALDN